MWIVLTLLASLAAPSLCQNFVYAYDMDQNAPPQSNLFDPAAYRFNNPSAVQQNYGGPAAPPVPVRPEPPQPAPVPRRQQRARQQAARTAVRRPEPVVRQEPVSQYEPGRQAQYQPQAHTYNQARAPAPPAIQQAYQLPSGNPSPDQIPEGYEVIEIPRSQIDSNGYFSLTQDGQRYQLIGQEPQSTQPPIRQATTPPRLTTPQPRRPAPENHYEISPSVYARNKPSTYEEFLRSLPTAPPQTRRPDAPGPQLSYQVTPPPTGTSYYNIGSRTQPSSEQYQPRAPQYQDYQPEAQQYQDQGQYQPETQQYQPQAQQYQPQGQQYQPEVQQYQPQTQQYQPQNQVEPQQYQPAPVTTQQNRPAPRRQPAPTPAYRQPVEDVPPPQVVHQRRRPAARRPAAVPIPAPLPVSSPSAPEVNQDGRPVRTTVRPSNIGVASLPEDTDGDGIPGQGGVDYPTLHTIPKTSFSCARQPIGGYYADLEAACQLVHFCQAGGIGHTFLCPNGTIFNQEKFSCQWWYKVDCASASQYYALNDNLYKVPSTTTRAPRRRPNAAQRQANQQRRANARANQQQEAVSNNNRPSHNPNNKK